MCGIMSGTSSERPVFPNAFHATHSVTALLASPAVVCITKAGRLDWLVPPGHSG
jgi:hypothetical protein